MPEVHYDNTIELLNKCPARDEIYKSGEPCNHCEFRSLSDCKTALMRKAAIEMFHLQNKVNEYSKCDLFLRDFGFQQATASNEEKDEEHGYILTVTQNDI